MLRFYSFFKLDFRYCVPKNAQICHKSRQSFPQQKLEKHNINSQHFIPMEFIFLLNFFPTTFEHTTTYMQTSMSCSYQKRTSVETFLNHSTFLLAQFNHKFNLDKLPVFGFNC